MRVWTEHETRTFCFDALRAALVKAQDKRSQWEGFFGGEPEWVIYERRVMQAETNRLRTRLGRASVDMEPIMAAEQQARGHFDYTKKFALGCADVVMAP